jgi:predicted nucleic acid-binding Zn ribbon protein
VSAEHSPDGVELAVAFVLARTGVAGEVALRPPRRRRRGRPSSEPATWSGPAPGPRDPVAAGSALDGLVASGGWGDQLAVHSVTGRWDEITGPAVAEHSHVESFTDGVLTVRCDSTAWATQLRMLVPQLLSRLHEEVGPGVVRTVEVKGPDVPSWVRGPRRVKGRGPRDTYG